LKLETRNSKLMSDRALQDRVIRYLTDAIERTGGPHTLPLSQVDAARAARFANFLARHYYRDRLARSFQYSYTLRERTGRSAEQIADSPEFDAFLPNCVLGSLESAERVGEMARRYLLAAAHPAPWWTSLVEYEHAYFLQAATSQLTPVSRFPVRGRSAVLKHFEWSMPKLLSKIRDFPPLAKASGACSNSSEKSGASTSVDEIAADDLRRNVTLLFSRNPEGKLFVVEVENAVAAVFNGIDGSRSIDEIASSAGVLRDEAQQVLAALANLGAVVPSPGP
jgi:hypothetical protein